MTKMGFVTTAVEYAQNEIMKLPIFSGIGWATVSRLLAGAYIKTCYKGEHLYQRGDPALYFGYVLSGTFKVSYIDDQGTEVILHFASRGEPLAIVSLMGGPVQFPSAAISMDAARFLMIPRENFHSLWSHIPELMLRSQQETQARLFRSYDDRRLLQLPLCQRVASLLMYLQDHKSASKEFIEIPITRREIAAAVGATVESVIRTMSAWTSQGWIATKDSFITIKDRESLTQIIQGDRALAEEKKKITSGFSFIWSRSALSMAGSPKQKYQ